MGVGWMSGLLGRQKVRGEVVDERLGAFVAPIVDVEPEQAADLDSVREHHARVRDSLRGAGNLNQRLNGESNALEHERLPERAVKGESFTAKMLEQRRRRKPHA